MEGSLHWGWTGKDRVMWLMLSDSFLSIVSKDCASDELLVRARRRGDIEKVFPEAVVTRTIKADYLYRAVLKRVRIAEALACEVDNMGYSNFKSSVLNKKLHNAYLRVWTAMASLQPRKRNGERLLRFGEQTTWR